jgi:predicted nuclease with TOPRIM domain
MEEKKKILIEKTTILKNKHEDVKKEMLNIVEASRILNEQYKVLEDSLYKIEDEYVELMREITKE